jgi:hypothetical protein
MIAIQKKSKKPKTSKKPQAPARPRPELNEASRAQLGPDEEKRPYRQRADDASVEDPLEDWPPEG